MSALIPFPFEGGEIRVVTLDGEPWFVGKDVASTLGYANPADAIKQHCKGVAKRYPLSTAGGTQEVRLLSEPDVLRLVVASKLPAAERFERWVFEVLLPTVRRTGQYGVQRDFLAELEIFQGLVAAIRAEPDNDVRAALYAQLEAHCRATGVPVPPWEGLRARRLAPPPYDPAADVEAFWKTVEALEGLGMPLNHSRDPRLFAVNLPQLQALAKVTGQGVPSMPALRVALRLVPGFRERATVCSALHGRAVKCWVFARETRPA